MRAFVILIVLAVTASASPGELAAASCDDALTQCYRSTILFGSPEAFDLVGCETDYLTCLGRALRFW